ncbi:hypothetical protein D6C89_08696 [Aureobasidium pullulans]|nr:hypothetical protein D6C89_08696 [Aureobasidium pullulans]
MTGRSTEPLAVLYTAQPPAALKQSSTSSMAPISKHFEDYTGPDCITPCPNEVLHKICSNLPFDVVKNFRLVCRIFGKIGNDHLNAQAHVCFKRTSFQELQRLSTSDLRKSIRSLCFDANRYNEQFTFEKWRRVVRVTSNIGRSQENQDAYDRFRHYYVDQDAIVQEDLHVESIATLLRNCPKLHTVEIWSAYEDLRIMQKAVPVFADAGISPRSRRGNFVHGVHAIKDVMQAANQTRTRLKRLFAGRLSQTLFHLEAVDTEIIKTGLEKVQCLSLEIDEPHPTTNFEATSWDKLSEGALSKLLGAASDVRYLSVRSRDSWSPAIATLYLNHIFGKHVFHYLRALHLRSVATNSKGLSKILIEHKETLEYVHLTNFNMVNNNDNWNDFFNVMCQQLPQARKFLLYGDWKGGNGASWSFGHISGGKSSLRTHAMNRYIRKGGDLPTTDEKCRQQIPNCRVVERSLRSPHVASRPGHPGFRRLVNASEHIEYIDGPDSDSECLSDDEDEDLKFWKAHL